MTVHKLKKLTSNPSADSEEFGSKDISLLNLVHVKAHKNPFSQEDLATNYELMLKIAEANTRVERERLKQDLNKNHAKILAKSPHHSEYRVILSREVDNFGDDSRYLGKQFSLLDYVSDRCLFDLSSNTFVEQDTRHSLAKIEQLGFSSSDFGASSND